MGARSEGLKIWRSTGNFLFRGGTRAGGPARTLDAKNDVCDLWDTDGELSVPRVSDIPEVSEVRVGGVQQLDARTITLWITLDNLRRGAALNGLQIAAELVKRHAD